MRVLVQHEYRANKKEPFGTLLRRIHGGLGQLDTPPSYRFWFADSLVPGGVSPVARAVKKFPQLAALVTTDSPAGGVVPGPPTIVGDQTNVSFEALAELADGLPRSLPFHTACVVFSHPAFGAVPSNAHATQLGLARCGIGALDNWWVNGRMRGLQSSYVVDVPQGQRKLPLPDGPLGVFLGTLGKPKGTVQYPVGEGAEGETISLKRASEALPELVELGRRIRARLPEVIAGAKMPHELPAHASAETHPLKPALVKHFKPLGYSCKGGSGTFSLRKRTGENHVVEIYLDVGTWMRSLTAFFRMHVPDYQCSLPMPAAPSLNIMQCPIGDAGRWEKIVENLAALTAHLEREVVPEISRTAGPAPEWFDAPR